jgi:hypothetical protein
MHQPTNDKKEERKNMNEWRRMHQPTNDKKEQRRNMNE